MSRGYSHPSKLRTGARSQSRVRRLARSIGAWRTTQQPSPLTLQPVTIVCVSDTHTTQPELPGGDLLIHAGDLSQNGSFQEIQDQLSWLHSQPHKYKVVIAGNHDLLLDLAFVDQFPQRILERRGTARNDLNWHDIIYLQDDSIKLEFGGGRLLNIYGSPWTQQFGTWSFQYPPIRDVWSGVIPEETDILVTHGPPEGYLDDGGKGNYKLSHELRRARPRLTIFGHIHAGHGRQDVVFDTVQNLQDDIADGRGGCISLLQLVCIVSWTRLLSLLPRLGQETAN